MSSNQPAATFPPQPRFYGVSEAFKDFRHFATELLSLFQSLPLAIVLLSLMATGILAGVLIPQDNLVDSFEIKRQFGPYYRVMQAFGLFNMFSSPGFLTLEVLFFFNLLLGSFRWLKPAFMAATHPVFLSPQAIGRSPKHWAISIGTVSGGAISVNKTPATLQQALQPICKTLKRHGFSVRFSSESPSVFYAQKASFSRLGPCVAHIGILCLLLSLLYGAFTGFKAQKLLAPGQQFTLSQPDRLLLNMPEPFWQGQIPNLSVKLHDFRTVFYPDHPDTPQQYYADLSVYTAQKNQPLKKPLKRQTISVNHPLVLGDLSIYQASFVPTGRLFMTLNGTPRTLSATEPLGGPINSPMATQPVSTVALSPAQIQSMSAHLPLGLNKTQQAVSLVIIPREQHIRVFLQQGDRFIGASQPGEAPRMPDNVKLTPGQTADFKGLKIGFVKAEVASGLLIKRAPETPWVYAAFGLIMLGTCMCLFTQRQLWGGLIQDPQNPTKTLLLLLPKTHKAKVSYQQEVQALLRDLYSETKNLRIEGIVY